MSLNVFSAAATGLDDCKVYLLNVFSATGLDD